MRFGVKIFAGLICLISLNACLEKAQTLSPEPSLLEQDNVNPSCPGITSVSVTSGPSLTVNWAEGSDNYSSASALTYKIFMRKNSESYDLVSPAKIVVGATTTIVSSGVGVGSTYTLFITCSDEKGNTHPRGPTNEYSISVSDSLPPSQITNLAVGSPAYTSLLLTWSPSDDGAGGTTAGNMRYKVYYSTTSPVGTGGAPLATVLNGGTSYLHTGLTPNTTYYYKVVAMDTSSNESVASNEASSTTLADTSEPTFSGNTSALVVTSSTTNTVNISWTAATDNVTPSGSLSYRIYRCAGSTTCDPYGSAPIATVTGGVTTFSNNGLSASTVYVYGVRAMDASNNVSLNTDKKITSTTYSASGTFYAYPTIDEVNLRLGTSVAVANVIGAATGPTAYPDLLVGAPNGSQYGSAYRWTGCVYVFAGTGVGQFSSTATSVFCQPSATASGGQNGANFGWAIATGDMDNDGIQDVIVSNPGRFTVYIFRTVNSGGTLSIGTTASTITHPSSNTSFGWGICVGNGDNVGADDLFIITATEDCSVACGGVTGTGNVLVYNNITTSVYIAPNSLSYKISPTHSMQAAGYNISNGEIVARSCTLGNFDPSNPSQLQLVVGSGTVTYASGTGNDGAISFYRKTAANTFAFQNVLPATTPAITGTRWGDSVAAIQLDSGTKELVVGATDDDNVGNNSGAVYLYTVSTTASNFVLADTGNTFYGGTDLESNHAGSAVIAADIWGHGDGKQDLVIGAYLDDNTMTIGASNLNNGQVFTYRNVNGMVGTAVQQTNFDTTQYRVRADHQYGTSLCKGDVNNDGLVDVIVGAPYTDYDPSTMTNNIDVGAVYVYYGVTAGEIDFDNPSQILYPPGAQGYGRFGFSCVVMDYNADGHQDLLVGSPYRDVVQGDRGVVYIYLGSSNTALPSSNSLSLNYPSPTTTALFGWALAKGDFDANGYDDLAVSAICVNTGASCSGQVLVFWADNTTHAISSTNYTTLIPPSGAYGSGGNPYLANTQTIQTDQNFGRALESFRTVSGSSGVDLIVCSLTTDTAANYHYSGSAVTADIGNCWIYEGKTNGGLVGNYQIMSTPRNEIRYPQGYSTPGNTIYFGSAVAKGDWNADGTEDLLVCAARQTNLITIDTNAGACWA
ncbi:MAG: hypothetical protein HC902_05050 [Calothrix sp. SM1_5_4]|nr:hypothetical protein [Calothrix sp. SM1_5_4]